MEAARSASTATATIHSDRAMRYRRSGRSGLELPVISLGGWHNFGEGADFANCRAIVLTAFEAGITHFDLANNYGPPPGHAELVLGKILKELPRDEIIISTKAGYEMWRGPYGNWGSRKHVLASLDQSLRRLQVDYVDIFYHHRPDPSTPIAESLGALDTAVRQGKALYAGISNYDARTTNQAVDVVRANSFMPLLVNQSCYSLINRRVDDALLQTAAERGLGVIAFSPLAQGMLTDRYLAGVPHDSRAARETWDSGDLKRHHITPSALVPIRKLDAHAKKRGQTLAQMALSWVLRERKSGPSIVSAVIGASKPEQLRQNIRSLDCPHFDDDELSHIDSLIGVAAPER
jgi:L-glyceraldehyde 3-phosphate reductase